jgi:glycosyltransferase involved in cell wall biosynthesis
MKIGIFTDQRFINTACPTGVGKHIEKMVLGLANNYNHDLSMLMTKDQLSNDGVLSNLPSKVIPMSWHAASLSWILLGRPYVDDWVGDLDWVYCPKNDLISCRKIKYAVTIHGAHELDPAFGVPRGNPIDSVRRLRSKIQYQKIFETAHVVFTVSNWLKEFIESNFNFDSHKIVVVGNGVDNLFYEHFESSFDYMKLENPYVLCL